MVIETTSKVLLRLLATSDLHAHVYPHDYYADRPWSGGGLAQAAAVISELRETAPLNLVVDDGDFLYGSPLTDQQIGVDVPKGVINPMIAAMNAVRYDVVTLGNHEFDYGVTSLAKTLGALNCPVVSSNLAVETPGGAVRPSWVRRWEILQRSVPGHDIPLRIGVVGFLPPQTALWNNQHFDEKLVVDDILRSARGVVDEVRNAGADLVIVLAHVGPGLLKPAPGDENVATALAGMEGVDALIAGHAHLVLPGPDYIGLDGVDAVRGRLQGRPAVMPGCFGARVGKIDLMLERSSTGWRVARHTSEAVPVSKNESKKFPALSVVAAAAAGHDRVLSHLRRAVARTSEPLHSYFSLGGYSSSVQIVAAAQRWWVERMLKGTSYDDLPVLGVASPSRAGGRAGAQNYVDIPAGRISRGQVISLQHFPNRIAALRMTGREVRDWLERAAAVFTPVIPGAQDVPLHDPMAPPFHFDSILGLDYTIDLSKPARYDAFGALRDELTHRVADLRYNGRSLEPDETVILAVSSFRASGGGVFPGVNGQRLVPMPARLITDIITDYLNEPERPAFLGPSPWRFARVPGASATLDISARAMDYLQDVAHLGICAQASLSPDVQRFRIDLDGLKDAAKEPM